MMTKVCIIYPADPVGTIPGGIDTFIRGILRWAPDDISLSLVGVTTDRIARPLGKWTECDLGRRKFGLYPIIALDDPKKRLVIPLSLRFSAALFLKKIARHFDILEFHRIEPSLLYYFSDKPKNVFIHQNMDVLHNKNSDIRWKNLPWLYYKLEDWLLPRMQSVFSVREDAVAAYRKRFPEIADRFHFIATWMDPDVFYPVTDDRRVELKARLGKAYGFNSNDVLLISVGRLDHQKDPLLLIDAFNKVARVAPDARLIMIGDGVLRDKILAHLEKLRLEDRVILAGLRSAAEIADLLRISSVFVLSSAYEGMPMCVLEALGSGLPAAVTDVGEIRRIIKPGINGEIAEDHSPDSLASAILACMKHYDVFNGNPCLDVALNYTPSKVLKPVYENYRHLAVLSRS
ncbi:glycosyltransferase family 1 protein [bacterium]|nr:MAG: glycosyltransferase family 1 protein [bacterium]